MTNQFDSLIKELKREAEDLKAVRRRSSLTLQTTTKSTTLSVVIRKANDIIFCYKAGLARIAFNSDAPQVFCAQFKSRGDRDNRGILHHSNYNVDGTAAVMVVPFYGEDWDDDLSNGDSKTISIPIAITSTGDFTLTADQITYEES